MPIMFNTILREPGLPPTDVRLIRHRDKRAARGRTPYELWRDNRLQFEWYQSTQSIPNGKQHDVVQIDADIRDMRFSLNLPSAFAKLAEEHQRIKTFAQRNR